jgi:uncharacterized DUF497 family protein
MDFEWDNAKAAANIARHAISFVAATQVFSDPNRFSIVDARRDYGEQRVNTTGMTGGVLVATVTHTDRAGVTRLISARHANRKERRKYHEQNNQNDS